MYQSLGGVSDGNFYVSKFQKYNRGREAKIPSLNDYLLYLDATKGIIDQTGNTTLTDYDGLTTTDAFPNDATDIVYDFDSKRLETDLITLTPPYTIECYFYLKSSPSYYTIFEFGFYTNGVLLRVASSTLDFWISNTNYSFSNSWTLNTWMHLAFVVGSGTSRVYLNGNQESSQPRQDTHTDRNLGIGYSRHSVSQRLNGYIGPIAIRSLEAYTGTSFDLSEVSIVPPSPRIFIGLTYSSEPVNYHIREKINYSPFTPYLVSSVFDNRRPKARITYKYRLSSTVVDNIPPEAWWDMSNLDSLTITNDKVERWNDLSGNGYDLIQTTEANRATYNTDSLNSVATSYFNSTVEGYLSGLSIERDYTYFLVSKSSTSGRILNSTAINALMQPSRTAYSMYHNGTINYVGPVPANQWNISSLIGRGAGSSESSAHYWRSSAYRSGNLYTTVDWGGLVIGNGPSLHDENPSAHVVEIIIYKRQLTVDEREQIESYLAFKWNLPDELVPGHPYKDSAPF